MSKTTWALIGAGVVAAWYFYQQSQSTGGTAAGVVPAATGQ